MINGKLINNININNNNTKTPAVMDNSDDSKTAAVGRNVSGIHFLDICLF